MTFEQNDCSNALQNKNNLGTRSLIFRPIFTLPSNTKTEVYIGGGVFSKLLHVRRNNFLLLDTSKEGPFRKAMARFSPSTYVPKITTFWQIVVKPDFSVANILGRLKGIFRGGPRVNGIHFLTDPGLQPRGPRAGGSMELNSSKARSSCSAAGLSSPSLGGGCPPTVEGWGRPLKMAFRVLRWDPKTAGDQKCSPPPPVHGTPRPWGE